MAALEAPADTPMMGIVHAALKRDLRRVRGTLVAVPAPGDRQRVALGRHVLWMLDFLHAHHTGEDLGLWPLVLRRNPDAAELRASMEALEWRTVPTALFPDRTRWRVRIRPVRGGTSITQSFTVVRAPALLDRVYARLIPAHQDRTAGLDADLVRLAAVARGGPRP